MAPGSMSGSIVPVVISGGAGSRLWPLSRASHPKQFLTLAGDRPLLSDTLLRTAGEEGFCDPVIIANADHRFLVAEAARQADMTPAAILLEPVGRNTAPAIAAAALWARDQDPDAVLLIQSSDHLIKRPDALLAAVRTALPAVQSGRIMTFGVTPDRPATSYGWIEAGAPLAEAPGCHAVAKFHEKPDLATAEAFLAAGRHAWNAGIFLARAEVLIAELEAHEPRVVAQVRAAIDQATTDIDFLRLAAEPFEASPSISIDHAVMERSDQVATIPVDMSWTDVGGFDALHGLADKDADGNAFSGRVVAVDVQNCHIRAESDRLIGVVGVSDITVVETADSILIAPTGGTEAVKTLVERLKAEGYPEADQAARVYRPWGWYQSVDRGDRFQVKRIAVKPGASLSLQMHHHRAEHWVVVKGTARVTVDDKDLLLTENQGTFIPLGATHRLENPGRVPLEMIEVQSGTYLGEDDIVRFSDNYGRE